MARLIQGEFLIEDSWLQNRTMRHQLTKLFARVLPYRVERLFAQRSMGIQGFISIEGDDDESDDSPCVPPKMVAWVKLSPMLEITTTEFTVRGSEEWQAATPPPGEGWRSLEERF